VAEPGADTHAGSNYANLTSSRSWILAHFRHIKADLMKEKGSLRRCPTGRACCSAWGSYLCGSVCVIPGAGVLGTGDADQVRFWAKLSSSAAPTSKSTKRTITARHPDGLEPRFDLYGPGRNVPFRRFGLREGAAGELPGQEKAARRARCCVSPGAGTATSRCAVVRRKGWQDLQAVA
jgi:hypothetical protein